MRLETVGKRYGVRQPWVVRGVTADVPGGRLIRVEGRNGSGKSTLLKVVAGVCLPSAGRVTGRPGCGYVPERFPGGLPFSARDYLLHMARVHGLRGAAGQRAVDEWLERLGAASYAAAPLRSLSKGMCQKVAIAQALLSRPGLLVLDEAWTGLDQAARGTLDAEVAERTAAGGSVLFVDHDRARLAGRASERWQLDGRGQVTVLPGDHAGPLAGTGPGNSPGNGTDTGAGGDPVVVLELDGLEAGAIAHLATLDGVLTVDAPPPVDAPPSLDAPPPVGAPLPAGAAPGHGRAAIHVTGARSDAVLRTALAWDGVHVRSVRPESGTARPGASFPEPSVRPEPGRPPEPGGQR